MWPSLKTAVWLYDLSNIGLIIGLTIGVVSTVLVVWMGNVKEENLNRDLAVSRERTASLEKQSDESKASIAKANAAAAQSLAAAKQAEANLAGANSRAEEARAAAAKASARSDEAKASSAGANARAAELEKDAANARLETERLKESVAWRTLPQESALILEKVLASKPGSVNLRYMDGDPEALFLAIQISQLLAKSSWQTAPGAVKPSNAIVFGISIPDNSSPDAKTLRDAFSKAKIQFSTNELPPNGVSFSISTIQGAPTLMVGSKIPALP